MTFAIYKIPQIIINVGTALKSNRKVVDRDTYFHYIKSVYMYNGRINIIEKIKFI